MQTPDLFDLLEKLNIEFTRIDHVPVFTSEQARELISPALGASAKNLFLRDKKGKRHFLITLKDDKTLDLKKLAKSIGSSRLSFASPERLAKHLQLEPGAVSPLALVNDKVFQVEFWIDAELYLEEFIQCHPLVNTSTLIMKTTDLEKFLDHTGHKINKIPI